MSATSTFTMRALVEALSYLEPSQTPLIRGRHGIGKSSIAYQMAPRWGLKRVIERRISQLSEGDMIGLPDRGATKKFEVTENSGIAYSVMREYDETCGGWSVTKFLPTDWFLEAALEPCLVFLDEINRGTPETMQASFQFVEKGELNGRKIHPESRIIAAINFSKEYQVTPLDPAFIDRFWVADLEPDKKDWIDWACSDIGRTEQEKQLYGETNIHPSIVSYINQCNENFFEMQPEKASQLDPSEIVPSRRSWDRLNKHLVSRRGGRKPLIESPNSQVFYDIARGFVGPAAARDLAKYIADNCSFISPQEIVDLYSNKDIKLYERVKVMRPEDLTSLVDKLMNYLKMDNVELNDKQASNIATFMKDVPPEIGFMIWTKMTQNSTHNARMLHSKSSNYLLEMIAKTKHGSQLKSNIG